MGQRFLGLQVGDVLDRWLTDSNVDGFAKSVALILAVLFGSVMLIGWAFG
jgi:hypothetical protein